MVNTLFNPTQLLRKFNGGSFMIGAGVLLLIALATWMIAAQFMSTSTPQQPDAQRVFEEKTGIRLTRIVLAAAGGVVDVHYQVLDPDKALAMHDRDRPPRVLHEASSQVLDKPFHSHVTTDRPRIGGAYRLQLLNARGMVHLGDKITLIVGDAHLEHVIVER